MTNKVQQKTVQRMGCAAHPLFIKKSGFFVHTTLYVNHMKRETCQSMCPKLPCVAAAAREGRCLLKSNHVWSAILAQSRFMFLSSEIISEHFAKASRTKYATPPKLTKRAPKVGGLAANFACRLFEFQKGETRCLIVLLEVFTRGPLIISYDNNRAGLHASHSMY